MAIKHLNFDKSFYYYSKNYYGYEPRECHLNVFQKFYDFNYEEVEKTEKSFMYVVGLLLIEDDCEKKCIIHSWVEKDNDVIDVTIFANSMVGPVIKMNHDELEKVKTILKSFKYLGIKRISNKALNLELKKVFYTKHFNRPEEAMNHLMFQWINEVENSRTLQEQIKVYGFKLDTNV